MYFLKDIIKDSLWAQTFVFQSQNDCWASWLASVFQAGGMCNKQESKRTKGKCFYLGKYFLFVWKRKITFSRTLTILPSHKAGTWPSPSSSHCGVWGVCTHLPTCCSPTDSAWWSEAAAGPQVLYLALGAPLTAFSFQHVCLAPGVQVQFLRDTHTA